MKCYTFQYDALGRIAGTERKGTNPVLAGKTAYGYSRAGRLTSWQEGGRSESYVYDRMGNLGRLLSWTEGLRTEAYGYDALGNRTAKSVDGTAVASCQYNGMNQLVKRTENGIDYHYGYDRRGNLTEERMGEAVIRRYVYDSAGYLSRGENLESGEATEYGYNALYMCVKNRVGNIGSASAGRAGAAAAERNYAVDFLSGTNRVLAAYEEGCGVLRSVYGPGYGCVSRELVPEPELPETALSESALPGASYFQPDINGLGGVLQYAGSDVWGRRREQEENGGSGFQGQPRFTSYSFDPIIGKYFAQARFYDAEQGCMMGKDPVKRGLNAYPYCDNDPVNYVDPTGEISNIVVGGIAGGVIGGAFGFAGSAVSQLMGGERFSMRKALGSAANGAVVGAVRGALITSGVGAEMAFASDFIGGAAGSALEQAIGNGRVSLKESLVSGATNAVSGTIYSMEPLKGLKGAGDALWKGALSGAATAGIRYLARDWDDGGSDLDGSVLGLVQGIGQMAISPYSKNRDPRRGCGVHSPLSNRVGEPMAYGYRYDVGSLKSAGSVRRKKEGFSMLGLLKEAAIGGVMGGLAGAAFYGAGKAVQALKESVRANKGGTPTVIYGTDDIANYQYNMIENPGPLAEMPNQPAKNFYGGRYNVEVLHEDKIMYRAGNANNPYGRWFTSEPPASVASVRIDTAVKPHWIDPKTGAWEASSYIDNVYAIKIPKGTTVYTGPVGPQGSAYMGGYNVMQTYIDAPWNFEVIGKTPLQ